MSPDTLLNGGNVGWSAINTVINVEPDLTVISPTVNTNENTATTGNVLVGASDTEGLAITATAGTFTTPAGGSVTIAANGNYTYTPASGYSGPDSFTFTAMTSDDSATGTVSITVVPTLRVTTFTLTDTGFVAVFNRALNLGTVSTPTLHLYDDSTGCRDPPTSQWWARPPGRFTARWWWIKTTRASLSSRPTLAAPTTKASCPTIPIRSRSSAPVPAAATVSRTPTATCSTATPTARRENNYVTTFVVNNPANAVVVSLPDFARGPGQAVNVPNTGSGLPLQLLNTAATAVTVTSVTMQLVYNSSLLTVTGASGVPGGSSVTLNTTTAGVAIITFTSPGLVLSGGAGQNIIGLTAQVPTSAPYAAKEILDLKNIQINGGTITAIDAAAIHVVGFLGDADGTGSYDVVDALRVAQVDVGIGTGFSAWPLADPTVIADVTGGGAITVVDALRLAQRRWVMPDQKYPRQLA